MNTTSINNKLIDGFRDIKGFTKYILNTSENVLDNIAKGKTLTILYVGKGEWNTRDRTAVRQTAFQSVLSTLNMEIVIVDTDVLSEDIDFRVANQKVRNLYEEVFGKKCDIEGIIADTIYPDTEDVVQSPTMRTFVESLNAIVKQPRSTVIDPVEIFLGLFKWESMGGDVEVYSNIHKNTVPIVNPDTEIESFKKRLALRLKGLTLTTKDVEYVAFDIETTGLQLYKEEIVSASFTVVYKQSAKRYAHGTPTELLGSPSCKYIPPRCEDIMKIHTLKEELAEDTYVLWFKNKNGKAFTLEVIKMLVDLGVKVVGHNIYQFDIPMLSSSLKDNIEITQIFSKGDFADTMVMAYAELNSINRPKLGLKHLALPWMGSYDIDVDVTDTSDSNMFAITQYNGMDTIATVGVYEIFNSPIAEEIKYLQKNPLFINDYKSRLRYFTKSQQVGKMLGLMKLVGMPVAPKEYMDKEIKKLEREVMMLESKLETEPVVKEAEKILTMMAYKKDNAKRKNKLTYDEYVEKKGFVKFNFNSTAHKKELFFNVMKFPKNIVATTKSGQPSTGKEAIDALIEYVENNTSKYPKSTIGYMRLIKEYLQKDKLLNAYMKPINEKAIVIPSGYMTNPVNNRTLHTNFKQTSVMTGRLSTSEGINFLALPAHGDMGTAVKKAFQAPDGWVFMASDYSALESRLLANESEDEEQAKPFVMGIDGHSLNTLAYFPDKMPDVVKAVEEAKTPQEYKDAVNSIKVLYPELRQESKPYTFGFSYGAGANKYGQKLYDRFWKLYKKTAEYYRAVEKLARQNGYVISKISGLKLECSDIRNPDLKAYEREAIKRKVGNFTIQSGNFLLLDAMAEFVFGYLIPRDYLFKKVKIINSIHDACYMLVKEDPELIAEVNNKWVELASRDYKDDQIVKLEISADIGYDWKDVEEIPMVATARDVEKVLATKKRICNG